MLLLGCQGRGCPQRVPRAQSKVWQHQVLLLQLGAGLGAIAEPTQSEELVVEQKFPVQRQNRGEFLCNVNLD